MDYVKQVLEENLSQLENQIVEMEKREKELKVELMNVQQSLLIMLEMAKQIDNEIERRL